MNSSLFNNPTRLDRSQSQSYRIRIPKNEKCKKQITDLLPAGQSLFQIRTLDCENSIAMQKFVVAGLSPDNKPETTSNA